MHSETPKSNSRPLLWSPVGRKHSILCLGLGIRSFQNYPQLCLHVSHNPLTPSPIQTPSTLLGQHPSLSTQREGWGPSLIHNIQAPGRGREAEATTGRPAAWPLEVTVRLSQSFWTFWQPHPLLALDHQGSQGKHLEHSDGNEQPLPCTSGQTSQRRGGPPAPMETVTLPAPGRQGPGTPVCISCPASLTAARAGEGGESGTRPRRAPQALGAGDWPFPQDDTDTQ